MRSDRGSSPEFGLIGPSVPTRGVPDFLFLFAGCVVCLPASGFLPVESRKQTHANRTWILEEHDLLPEAPGPSAKPPRSSSPSALRLFRTWGTRRRLARIWPTGGCRMLDMGNTVSGKRGQKPDYCIRHTVAAFSQRLHQLVWFSRMNWTVYLVPGM